MWLEGCIVLYRLEFFLMRILFSFSLEISVCDFSENVSSPKMKFERIVFDILILCIHLKNKAVISL